MLVHMVLICMYLTFMDSPLSMQLRKQNSTANDNGSNSCSFHLFTLRSVVELFCFTFQFRWANITWHGVVLPSIRPSDSSSCFDTWPLKLCLLPKDMSAYVIAHHASICLSSCLKFCMFNIVAVKHCLWSWNLVLLIPDMVSFYDPMFRNMLLAYNPGGYSHHLICLSKHTLY